MGININDVSVVKSYHDMDKKCEYGDCISTYCPYVVYADEIYPADTYCCKKHLSSIFSGRRCLGINHIHKEEIPILLKQIEDYKNSLISKTYYKKLFWKIYFKVC